MEGQPRSTGQQHGEFTDEAVRALRALSGYPGEPILLGYHPVARMNPYQGLLYQGSWEAGIAAVPIVRPERVPELTQLVSRGFTGVLHLHWLNLVLADAGSPADARKATDAFLRDLDGFRKAGGRLAWTVHNILPHASRHDEQEARLRGGVVERCDVVHVMTPQTPEQVRSWFQIPDEKVLFVEHPSYAGAYEDWISRAQARHELGIMPDEVVYAVVGAIRPYKGLNELLDAWERLDDGRPRRLVIAGGPSEEDGVAEALERAAVHPTVLLHARQIPSDEIQLFLRAADVAVLPYTRSLNSGAQLLALTFGLPVIVPAGGGLEEVVDTRFARTFEPGDTDDLARALLAADELLGADARAAALEEAERRSPAVLSARFAHGLRERLGLTPQATGPASSPTDEPASGAPSEVVAAR
jgi:glycosyltransferase involved in cell wall biosynthesis